jgi:prolyl-tRNA synthetase
VDAISSGLGRTGSGRRFKVRCINAWFLVRWLKLGQDWFNKKIKAMGVQNASFPMFVSAKVLEREKDHIEGFSPEVAWVTRA